LAFLSLGNPNPAVNELPSRSRRIVRRLVLTSAVVAFAATGAASSATAANRACSLIKASDAGVALGGSIKTTARTTSASSICTYSAGDAVLKVVVYKARTTRASFQRMRASLHGATAKGLGVPAFWLPTKGSFAALDALKGSTWFSVSLRDPPRTRDQLQIALKGIALIALSRL